MLSLSGIGIGRGIAIGRAMVLDHSHRQIPEFTLTQDRVEDEVRRFTDLLLYKSDDPYDMKCVDIGCRRIIKKK